MDNQTFIKKAFHTALIIAVPSELMAPIQNIRRNNDKAYERWMPHVNLAFPFFDVPDFDQARLKLQETLENFDSFEIKLGTFNYFDHGKNCVLWLKPDSEGDMVNLLHQEIVRVFPQLNDLAEKGENGYAPHLTCGTFNKNNIDKVIAQYQKNWKPITFTLKNVDIILRDSQTSPFYTKEIIQQKLLQIQSKKYLI